MRWRGGVGAGTVDKQIGRETAVVRLVLCAQAAASTHLDGHLYAVLYSAMGFYYHYLSPPIAFLFHFSILVVFSHSYESKYCI